MTTKTTDSTTPRNTAKPTPRPLRAPPARTHQKSGCGNCQHIDTADKNVAADGVGWCTQNSQYRHMHIARVCDSFIGNKRSKK